MHAAFFMQSLDGLPPRRRALAALAAGMVCALGLPPLNLFPVLWLGLPLLLLLLRGTKRPRQAFVLGWLFAFGYFVIGFYWIAAALFVDIKQFFWLLPFTLAGLPAALAVYYGLACWVVYHSRLQGVASALLLAALFGLAEFARGHLFTGFPWNLFGYVWADILPMAQSVSLFGSYGLTLVTLVAACLPAALVETPRRQAAVANLLAFTCLVALAVWGGLRLADNPTAYTTGNLVRLVQPNIAQQVKWDPQERERNFQTLLGLSTDPAAQPVTHIIWPETALTGFVTEDATRRAVLAAALPAGAYLLTGTVRRLPDSSSNRWDFFNSLVALAPNGDVAAVYNKFHLVPFGEYVPLRGFAPVASLTSGMGAFTAGPGPQNVTVAGLPVFSPLICYEVIFPGVVVAPERRPQLLLNITNDGWYGNTAGPYQHLASARMRAIEEGLPLLRVANTGISAVVDAQGRVLQSLPLGSQGVLDTAVPAAGVALLFARFGNWIFCLMLFVLSAGIAILRNRI